MNQLARRMRRRNPPRPSNARGMVIYASLLLLPLAACQSAVLPPSAPRGEVQRTLPHDGRSRSYLVYLPAAAESPPVGGLPVVLAFHGGGGNARGMSKLTGLSAVAEASGFIVVYPEGVEKNWNDGRPGIAEGIDDVGYVAALLDDLAASFPVDAARVYATGISNGGMMSYRLAIELSDRIAAVAPVAAQLSVNLRDLTAAEASPAKPVPILMILGEQDPLVPFGGGKVGGKLFDRGQVLSAEQTIQFWVARNRAAAAPEDKRLAEVDPRDGTAVRTLTHLAGPGGGEVTALIVEGGGHTWPGGLQYLGERLIGRTSREFSASQTIWDFFARHRRTP